MRECVDGGYASATIRNQWSQDRDLGFRVVMQPYPLWPLTLSPLCATCMRGTDLCLAPMDSDPAAGDLGGPSMSRRIACLFPQTRMKRNSYRRHARSDHIIEFCITNRKSILSKPDYTLDTGRFLFRLPEQSSIDKHRHRAIWPVQHRLVIQPNEGPYWTVLRDDEGGTAFALGCKVNR
jgi:hypothetical protein